MPEFLPNMCWWWQDDRYGEVWTVWSVFKIGGEKWNGTEGYFITFCTVVVKGNVRNCDLVQRRVFIVICVLR